MKRTQLYNTSLTIQMLFCCLLAIDSEINVFNVSRQKAEVRKLRQAVAKQFQMNKSTNVESAQKQAEPEGGVILVIVLISLGSFLIIVGAVVLACLYVRSRKAEKARALHREAIRAKALEASVRLWEEAENSDVRGTDDGSTASSNSSASVRFSGTDLVWDPEASVPVYKQQSRIGVPYTITMQQNPPGNDTKPSLPLEPPKILQMMTDKFRAQEQTPGNGKSVSQSLSGSRERKGGDFLGPEDSSKNVVKFISESIHSDQSVPKQESPSGESQSDKPARRTSLTWSFTYPSSSKRDESEEESPTESSIISTSS